MSKAAPTTDDYMQRGNIHIVASLLRSLEVDRPKHPAHYLQALLLRSRGGMKLNPEQLLEFLTLCTAPTRDVLVHTLASSYPSSLCDLRECIWREILFLSAERLISVCGGVEEKLPTAAYLDSLHAPSTVHLAVNMARSKIQLMGMKKSTSVVFVLYPSEKGEILERNEKGPAEQQQENHGGTEKSRRSFPISELSKANDDPVMALRSMDEHGYGEHVLFHAVQEIEWMSKKVTTTSSSGGGTSAQSVTGGSKQQQQQEGLLQWKLVVVDTEKKSCCAGGGGGVAFADVAQAEINRDAKLSKYEDRIHIVKATSPLEGLMKHWEKKKEGGGGASECDAVILLPARLSEVILQIGELLTPIVSGAAGGAKQQQQHAIGFLDPSRMELMPPSTPYAAPISTPLFNAFVHKVMAPKVTLPSFVVGDCAHQPASTANAPSSSDTAITQMKNPAWANSEVVILRGEVVKKLCTREYFVATTTATASTAAGAAEGEGGNNAAEGQDANTTNTNNPPPPAAGDESGSSAQANSVSLRDLFSSAKHNVLLRNILLIDAVAKLQGEATKEKISIGALGAKYLPLRPWALFPVPPCEHYVEAVKYLCCETYCSVCEREISKELLEERAREAQEEFQQQQQQQQQAALGTETNADQQSNAKQVSPPNPASQAQQPQPPVTENFLPWKETMSLLDLEKWNFMLYKDSKTRELLVEKKSWTNMIITEKPSSASTASHLSACMTPEQEAEFLRAFSLCIEPCHLEEMGPWVAHRQRILTEEAAAAAALQAAKEQQQKEEKTAGSGDKGKKRK